MATWESRRCSSWPGSSSLGWRSHTGSSSYGDHAGLKFAVTKHACVILSQQAESIICFTFEVGCLGYRSMVSFVFGEWLIVFQIHRRLADDHVRRLPSCSDLTSINQIIICSIWQACLRLHVRQHVCLTSFTFESLGYRSNVSFVFGEWSSEQMSSCNDWVSYTVVQV